MNNPTVQDIFTLFYEDYLDKYTPSPRQAKAAYHITNCKTGVFGSNTSICSDCGCFRVHHNSCHDRNCPMCQELPKEKWIDRQKEDLLDAPYFHIVFTLPEELNPLIYCNQKELYNLMYQTSSETLKELAADSKYLGAEIGFLSVLHMVQLNAISSTPAPGRAGWRSGSAWWLSNEQGRFLSAN